MRVQAARACRRCARSISKTVPPELETVLMKALTEDPDQRYLRARDFGTALNQLLFKMGRSVSSFDIAELVEPIRKEREQKRIRGQAPVDHRHLDRRSHARVHVDRRRRRSQVANRRLEIVGSLPLEMGGFNAPNDWGEDLGNLGLSAPRAREQSGDAFEIGNLAALEDDPLSKRIRPLSSSPPSADDDSEPPPAERRRTAKTAVIGRAARALFRSQRAQGKGGIVTAVVVALLIAAGAGAYFGGLIPH